MSAKPERPRRYAVWEDTGREVQLAQLREALEGAAGNVTKAGEALGFKRRFVFRMVRAHGLNEYAAELRLKAGGGRRGRPKNG